VIDVGHQFGCAAGKVAAVSSATLISTWHVLLLARSRRPGRGRTNDDRLPVAQTRCSPLAGGAVFPLPSVSSASNQPAVTQCSMLMRVRLAVSVGGQLHALLVVATSLRNDSRQLDVVLLQPRYHGLQRARRSSTGIPSA